MVPTNCVPVPPVVVRINRRLGTAAPLELVAVISKTGAVVPVVCIASVVVLYVRLLDVVTVPGPVRYGIPFVVPGILIAAEKFAPLSNVANPETPKVPSTSSL